MQGTSAPLVNHGTFAGGGADAEAQVAGLAVEDDACATCGTSASGGLAASDAPSAGGAPATGSCATKAPIGAPAVGSPTGVSVTSDLSPESFKRKQEMDIYECVNLLRNRIRQLHPCDAEWIVSYAIASKTHVELRQYLLDSDDQIQRLIVEAKYFGIPSVQECPQLAPPQPTSGEIYMPFIHWQHGIRPILHPMDQVGPLLQHQFHPGSSSHEIQALNNPIGTIGVFQNPFPGFTGLGEQFQSLSISCDGSQSNYGNASQSVTAYSPSRSRSKEQTKPCHFHFSMGPEMANIRQLHTIESLPILEKEISELLLSLRPPKVRIESLASFYIKRYGKPLKIKVSCTKGQHHDHNFTHLLTMLCTTRVIERRGERYIVPVGEASKYLDDDFKLVMPPPRNASNQIYITFEPKSTFAKEDVWNYFSQYGPVSDVRIPLRKKRTFGYVSFRHPWTAKRILSERSPMNPHLICGEKIYAKAWKAKHELEKLAQKGDVHKASGVNAIHEHHTADDAAESSSHVQSHFDEATTAEDCDDLGLPRNLDDIY